MKRKIDVIALVIIIAGAVNCGLIGVFDLNVISWLFGEQTVVASRIIHIVSSLAGLWCINLLVVKSKKRTTPYLGLGRSIKSFPNGFTVQEGENHHVQKKLDDPNRNAVPAYSYPSQRP